MNKNDYIIRAMAKLAFPEINLKKVQFIERYQYDLIRLPVVDYISFDRELLFSPQFHCDEYRLEGYGYQSNKRRVIISFAYAENRGLLFYKGLEVIDYKQFHR